MAKGATPSRLKAFKKLRAEIDAELAKAITIEQAMQQGLVEHGDCYAVRIWENCIEAIAECKKLEERGAVLVKRRDDRDVQVWVKPVAAPEPEPQPADVSGASEPS